MVTDKTAAMPIISGVATQRKKTGPPTRSPHLYISEWFDHLSLSDEDVGRRLGKARETVWRWRVGQRQLTVDKLVLLARALDIEPEQFWQPPARPSIDALLKYASDDDRAVAFDIVSRLTRRS